MGRGLGQTQLAILAKLRHMPKLDVEGVARRVYNVWRPHDPTRSQINTIQRALLALGQKNLIKPSSYRSEKGRQTWVVASSRPPKPKAKFEPKPIEGGKR